MREFTRLVCWVGGEAVPVLSTQHGRVVPDMAPVPSALLDPEPLQRKAASGQKSRWVTIALQPRAVARGLSRARVAGLILVRRAGDEPE